MLNFSKSVPMIKQTRVNFQQIFILGPVNNFCIYILQKQVYKLYKFHVGLGNYYRKVRVYLHLTKKRIAL